ncbi:MAG: GAF domain-containing protein [Elusimicrobia bacterium]|nr:GAF domain-containing protein [Elusimicrobiota bacterium]
MTGKELKDLQKKNDNLRGWKHKLSMILKFSSQISSSSDIQEIVKIIADWTNKILESDRCSVYLLDEEKKELYNWVSHGLKSREIRLPFNIGLAGHALKTGKVINVKNAYRDRRFNRSIDKKTGYKSKAVLCMPLKNQKGEKIGVFEVLNKKSGYFTKQDEEILGLLAKQAAAAIENAKLYIEIKKTFISFIDTLSETLDARDPMTAGHSRRVCKYAVLVAKKLGYSKDKMEAIKYAALLHDLGKIGVKESILQKPTKLTREEFAHIQTHTLVTRKILEQTYLQPQYRDLPLIAASHHENVDGTGYPDKLKGHQIPEMAKIIAIVDVFDAFTYKRQYSTPVSIEKAVDLLEQNRDTKFDSYFLDVFLGLEVYDILKVLTEGDINEVPRKASLIFNGMTLGQLADSIRKGDLDGAVDEFCKYYPVRVRVYE